jgi:hypothetical protein
LERKILLPASLFNQSIFKVTKHQLLLSIRASFLEPYNCLDSETCVKISNEFANIDSFATICQPKKSVLEAQRTTNKNFCPSAVWQNRNSDLGNVILCGFAFPINFSLWFLSELLPCLCQQSCANWMWATLWSYASVLYIVHTLLFRSIIFIIFVLSIKFCQKMINKLTQCHDKKLSNMMSIFI